MRICKGLGALLLASSALFPVHAQERPGSLQDAERAFADALIRHDRVAFMALFAPTADAVMNFPMARDHRAGHDTGRLVDIGKVVLEDRPSQYGYMVMLFPEPPDGPLTTRSGP